MPIERNESQFPSEERHAGNEMNLVEYLDRAACGMELRSKKTEFMTNNTQASETKYSGEGW